MRASILVLVAVLALSGAACARTLDRGSLEETLTSQVRDELDEDDITVSCPDGVEVEEGSVFECTATGADGATVTVEVTQLNDEGRVEWRLTDAGTGS
jgi:translation initiation factor IF-1